MSKLSPSLTVGDNCLLVLRIKQALSQENNRVVTSTTKIDTQLYLALLKEQTVLPREQQNARALMQKLKQDIVAETQESSQKPV